MLALAGVTFCASAAHAGERYATRLTVVDHPQQKATVVEVTFTQPPAYLARFSDEKRRLIIDVMDADVRGVPETFSRPTGMVKSVLVQAFGAGNTKTTRLLVALGAPGQAAISVEGQRLVIRLEPADGQEPAPLAVVDGKPVELPPPSVPAPVAAPTSAPIGPVPGAPATDPAPPAASPEPRAPTPAAIKPAAKPAGVEGRVRAPR
jgi:hypothetical protein